jgi:UDP:flavonoid glycosyltransferase YjiC (YdhE family)
MPRVDLAVTAGGQGSVRAALTAGVPSIGIPLQPEQDANVALAERPAAARLVPRSAAGTATLTRTAREMLATVCCGHHARRVQALYARVDGPGAAAAAILALAGAEQAPAHRPPTTPSAAVHDGLRSGGYPGASARRS